MGPHLRVRSLSAISSRSFSALRRASDSYSATARFRPPMAGGIHPGTESPICSAHLVASRWTYLGTSHGRTSTRSAPTRRPPWMTRSCPITSIRTSSPSSDRRASGGGSWKSGAASDSARASWSPEVSVRRYRRRPSGHGPEPLRRRPQPTLSKRDLRSRPIDGRVSAPGQSPAGGQGGVSGPQARGPVHGHRRFRIRLDRSRELLSHEPRRPTDDPDLRWLRKHSVLAGLAL